MTTLNKIRNEIEQMETLVTKFEVLDIIDKYAEQEQTDTWSIKDVADTFKKHGLIVEQEPCEDTVSRKEIIEHYTTGEMANVHHIDKNHLLAFVEQLPSVRPQEQTGHWIRQDNTKEPLYGWYFCSECNSVIGDKTEFCSNCGAKMESEDKE